MVFCTVLLSCNQPVKELKVVTFSGCNFIDNVATHGAEFGSLADSGETNALLLSDGDLLYAVVEEDDDVYMGYLRYKSEYGQHLEISPDSIYTGALRVNGKVHTLSLFDDTVNMDLNEMIAGEDLTDLMFIDLNGEVGENNLAALKLISKTNPEVGLYFNDMSGGIDSAELFYEILSLFHPACLILPDMELDKNLADLAPNFDNLELLFFSAENLKSPGFLYNLPSLKSLIIYNWDPDGPDPVRFEKIKSLESLALFEPELNSVQQLGNPEMLQSLYLNFAYELIDIDRIKEFPKLNRLGLLDCDTINDVSVLTEIPSLQWLSFPPEISQESFDQIINHHASLQGVEMLYCDSVKDLSSLVQLKVLKSLTIALDEIDYKSLEQLTGIELIVIDEGQFDFAEDEIAALKEALPDTHIVPGGGFCMGSGWVLLLIPVLLLAFGYRRFIRN